MKRTIRGIALLTFCICALFMFRTDALASEPTDEITNFDITVDVNQDASLDITYHIRWLVLESDELGPLEWVDLGMPNRNYYNLEPESDTISRIDQSGSSIAIYLDKEYYEGETVDFTISFTQNAMYQIDRYREGESVYTFTPAWFDSIDIDEMTIRWNGANAVSWQPDCQMEGDSFFWETALDAGERMTISVEYPNDAYAFTVENSRDALEEESEKTTAGDVFFIILGLALIFVFICAPSWIILKLIRWIASAGKGFGTQSAQEKKITRTKIEYYANCPSCGAARTEGKDNCEYCGGSMVKSKEVVEEEEIEHPEKYTKTGTYHYGSSPDTYIHVNVINIPRTVSSSSWRSSSRSSSTRSSSSRSSSASRSSSRGHSSGSSHHSCACACASSCACACACASSGRAGCSVKNFFDEDLHNRKYTVEARNRQDA